MHKIILVVVLSFFALNGWLKCCFTSTETIGLLGTGAQDGHLDFHTAPDLCSFSDDDEVELHVLGRRLTY